MDIPVNIPADIPAIIPADIPVNTPGGMGQSFFPKYPISREGGGIGQFEEGIY
jgi:hypothetical protein